jgi:hypothetical protein
MEAPRTKEVDMKILALGFALMVALAPFHHADGEELPAMTVWKNPLCGCCGNWVAHMRANGFSVKVHETENLEQMKKMAGIPEPLQSCHTARVGDYVVEGHVPAADVKRLLAARPAARGLAVPGMPSGSPGMENGAHDAYDVILFERDGGTRVFSSHK